MTSQRSRPNFKKAADQGLTASCAAIELRRGVYQPCQSPYPGRLRSSRWPPRARAQVRQDPGVSWRRRSPRVARDIPIVLAVGRELSRQAVSASRRGRRRTSVWRAATICPRSEPVLKDTTVAECWSTRTAADRRMRKVRSTDRTRRLRNACAAQKRPVLNGGRLLGADDLLAAPNPARMCACGAHTWAAWARVTRFSDAAAAGAQPAAHPEKILRCSLGSAAEVLPWSAQGEWRDRFLETRRASASGFSGLWGAANSMKRAGCRCAPFRKRAKSPRGWYGQRQGQCDGSICACMPGGN